MELISLFEYSSYEELYKMWNSEYGNIFPITKSLFDRNTRNAYDKASFVALVDNIAVGFIIGKVWSDEYEIKGYEDCGWINLIYVLPRYRKLGIGTALLNKAENEFEILNKKVIHLGRDYLNYFTLNCQSLLFW